MTRPKMCIYPVEYKAQLVISVLNAQKYCILLI